LDGARNRNRGGDYEERKGIGRATIRV